MYYGTASPDENSMEYTGGTRPEGRMGDIRQGEMRARQWPCSLARGVFGGEAR